MLNFRGPMGTDLFNIVLLLVLLLLAFNVTTSLVGSLGGEDLEGFLHQNFNQGIKAEVFRGLKIVSN